MYDLVHETAPRAGHGGIVHIVPLRRQTGMIVRGSGALGSVTRLPEREAGFYWTVRLFEERLVLVTLAVSPADIDTPAAKWSEAFKTLRRDGGDTRIMQRYRRQEEP